jgi:L-arabinonolactonase
MIDIFVDAPTELGECPLWDERTLTLWWVDIHQRLVLEYSEGQDAPRQHKFNEPVGAIALQENGRLMVALADAFVDYDPKISKILGVTPVDVGRSGVRLNDGRCDRQGRFLCGGMDMDNRGDKPARVHSFDRDGCVRTVIQGIDCANSICFSPDGTLMYFADMPSGQIQVYDYDMSEGSARNPRLLVERDASSGLPDGSVTDAEGCLWNARWGSGQVIRYSPDGKIDRIVELPVKNITCVAFGGSRHSTLFITTAHYGLSEQEKRQQPAAGTIFAFEPGVRGLPEVRYARGKSWQN